MFIVMKILCLDLPPGDPMPAAAADGKLLLCNLISDSKSTVNLGGAKGDPPESYKRCVYFCATHRDIITSLSCYIYRSGKKREGPWERARASRQRSEKRQGTWW